MSGIKLGHAVKKLYHYDEPSWVAHSYRWGVAKEKILAWITKIIIES